MEKEHFRPAYSPREVWFVVPWALHGFPAAVRRRSLDTAGLPGRVEAALVVLALQLQGQVDQHPASGFGVPRRELAQDALGAVHHLDVDRAVRAGGPDCGNVERRDRRRGQHGVVDRVQLPQRFLAQRPGGHQVTGRGDRSHPGHEQPQPVLSGSPTWSDASSATRHQRLASWKAYRRSASRAASRA